MEGALIWELGTKRGRVLATLTSQSSNSARSAVPAWSAKVISYVLDCTGLTSQPAPLLRAQSLTDRRADVMTVAALLHQRQHQVLVARITPTRVILRITA